MSDPGDLPFGGLHSALRAAAEATRLRVLVLLAEAELTVSDLTEILRQAQVGAGSTRQPFEFFITAAVLYLLLSTFSGMAFQRAEVVAMRSVRRS